MRSACALAIAFVLLAPTARADEKPPVTVVRLDGANDDVVLERVADAAAVCSGVCRRGVPSGVYRLGGAGVTPSVPFVVDGDRAHYEVDVHWATAHHHHVGTGLLAGGAAALAVSAVLIGVAIATMNDPCSGLICISPAPIAGAFGGLSGLVGVVLMFEGGALMAEQTSSTPTGVRRVAGVGLVKAF